jgi:hypothetical protein
VLDAFYACDDEQKAEALYVHLFRDPFAATAVVGMSTSDLSEMVAHLLSRLPPDEKVKDRQDEATRSRVLTSLLGMVQIDQDARLKLAQAPPPPAERTTCLLRVQSR